MSAPRQGPLHGGPAHGGPAHGGPAHGGPAHGGPAHGGPAHGGPVHGGTAHPTAVALSGFFVGMAVMLAIPATFAAVAALFSSTADLVSLAPLGLLPFAIPLVLIVVARTRLFGWYLLIGMVSTALVVAVVAGAVLFVLVRTS